MPREEVIASSVAARLGTLPLGKGNGNYKITHIQVPAVLRGNWEGITFNIQLPPWDLGAEHCSGNS